MSRHSGHAGSARFGEAVRDHGNPLSKQSLESHLGSLLRSPFLVSVVLASNTTDGVRVCCARLIHFTKTRLSGSSAWEEYTSVRTSPTHREEVTGVIVADWKASAKAVSGVPEDSD